MKPPEIKKVFPNMVSNPSNYMESFAKNIKAMKKFNGFSAEKFSEISNISLDTVKNLVSGKATDCKLSTAVKIAKIFGISIDELVGCGTSNDEVLKFSEAIRKLPKHEHNILMFYIDRLNNLNNDDFGDLPKEMYVMNPLCLNGSLKWSEESERLDVSNLSTDIRSKSFMALKVPCSHYMPVYDNGDILLLAGDRQPLNGEHCVVEINNYMYVVRCVKSNGKLVFNSIVNEKLRACTADHKRILGYVAHVVKSE